MPYICRQYLKLILWLVATFLFILNHGKMLDEDLRFLRPESLEKVKNFVGLERIVFISELCRHIEGHQRFFNDIKKTNDLLVELSELSKETLVSPILKEIGSILKNIIGLNAEQAKALARYDIDEVYKIDQKIAEETTKLLEKHEEAAIVSEAGLLSIAIVRMGLTNVKKGSLS